MTVFRLIFRDAFPLQRYEIEGHVVIRCITHDDVTIGEILLTTIAQGYTVNGGGFRHHPAKSSMELLSQRATTAVRIAAVKNSCCQKSLLLSQAAAVVENCG